MNYKNIIKIAVSLIFLVFVIYKIDLTFLMESVLSIKPGYYILSFFIMVINSLILAWKYKVLMKPIEIYQPFFNLVKINFICRFYSIFLTAAVGQGVMRWHMTTKNQVGRFKFLAVMIVERSTFLCALLLSMAISLVFVQHPNVKEISDGLYPFVIAGLFVVAIFFIYLNYSVFFNFINRLASKFNVKKDKGLIDRLAASFSVFGLFYKKRKMLGTGLLLSFAWQLFFLTRVFLLINSMDIPLSFIQITWMASLVFLLQVLPVSLSGIGLREAAYAFLFRLQDLPPEKGVLIGILFFSQMLLISLIGGILQLISKD